MHTPGIPAVEAEGDLVHAAWVSHHLVKTRLKTEGKLKQLLPKRAAVFKDAGEMVVFGLRKNYIIKATSLISKCVLLLPSKVKQH